MKRIAIIQSAYVPWRGFFDLIARCDEYVIFDSVQYAKRHWHNRNRIVAPQGPIWLSIPVSTKSRFDQPIEDVQVSEPWAEKHWTTIASNYRRAAHFGEISPRIERLYEMAAQETYLTQVNELFLREIASLLNLATSLVRDSRYSPTGSKSARLVDICIKAKATHYMSGPSARAYLDERLFREAGLKVEWMDYPAYPPYLQPWKGFEPAVSILDLLLNVGTNCDGYWRNAPY